MTQPPPFGLPDAPQLSGRDVIDSARDDGFTGEVVVESEPVVRIYLDRGRVYLAERATDPTLGERLVARGALEPAQLACGSIQVGGTEYLGRLFARGNGVDRAAVVCATEAMNDDCLGWLADQQVAGVIATPYRRHPSSLHRWDEPSEAEIAALPAVSPLPPPPASAQPVSMAPPDALSRVIEAAAAAAAIRWDEPSWLDERPLGSHCRIAEIPAEAPDGTATDAVPTIETTAPPLAEPAFDLSISTDWLDGLGLDAPSAPEARTPQVPGAVDGATASLTLDPPSPAAVNGHAPLELAAPSDAPASPFDHAPSSDPARAARSVEQAHEPLTPPTDLGERRRRNAQQQANAATDSDDTARTAALRRLVGGLRNT